jgi:hypothetical protein
MKDSAYIRQRNKLIPLAEVCALNAAGPHPGGKTTSKANEEWGHKFNREFFKQMDRLAFEKGLTTSRGVTVYAG